MLRLPSTVSLLISLLRRALWDGSAGKYHPEDHYMRGPGPKWREKHFGDRTPAGGR
ncbi:hypothetical protein SAMN05444159_6835 [Bradyrhizobium lablabi]|jgi:hypothetical protein|uniref:Uncharacterized protein n=1 Tax=Bradyrhizobium lablabi TaxID=722472 RepID=A0A1M7DJN9_9BRAD|nr:hypothetical protein SAMN05444159_6835 [Bradyrhizobium lablabi]